MKNRKTNKIAENKNGIVIPVASQITDMLDDYISFINELKNQIKQERLKTVLAANSALVVTACPMTSKNLSLIWAFTEKSQIYEQIH